METVIRLEGLTKYYGKNLGVADLNLEVKSGEKNEFEFRLTDE